MSYDPIPIKTPNDMLHFLENPLQFPGCDWVLQIFIPDAVVNDDVQALSHHMIIRAPVLMPMHIAQGIILLTKWAVDRPKMKIEGSFEVQKSVPWIVRHTWGDVEKRLLPEADDEMPDPYAFQRIKNCLDKAGIRFTVTPRPYDPNLGRPFVPKGIEN